MNESISRRDAVKHLMATGAGVMFAGTIRGSSASAIMIAGKPVEIAVWSLSTTTVRITVRPIDGSTVAPVPYTGALAKDEPGTRHLRASDTSQLTRVRAGNLTVSFTESPPTIVVRSADGKEVQRLTLNASTGVVNFPVGSGPLLGFGEGGAQFDRRGSIDDGRNGQGARSNGPKPFLLDTHGTRAPVQWMIGTADGWAMFIHQPYGAFDFTGPQAVFTPRAGTDLPLDVFVVASRDPKVIMREYALISGYQEMPARWTLGYQQSSRTLAGPDEILGVARTFRDKRLPCDTLIYLGTEFTPSGWNTRNGEFNWHPGNFPKPKEMLDTLHAQNFRVVLHVVIEGRTLTGSVNDPCTAEPLPPGRTPDDRWPPNRQASCYWPAHKAVSDLGVDGWWPDQGDGLDGPSRLNRHRMYWEGGQQFHPNERTFSLHRNASPGIQRYGGYIWSGDTRGRWETLAVHVPIAINCGLSGFPLWGSDIGGFNPTAESTAELHTRWFQFGAFCPSFRAHGRNWHVKLPWGWNGGDGGPAGDGGWKAPPGELEKPETEVVMRKYLEFRYRMMSYLYTALRETHTTGLPIMRALWLHYPTDSVAVARGDQFMWGPDMLVAPVVEKGATERKVYLPVGTWFDHWTEERVAGGREISKPVDLSTTPVYVRAGAVLPVGPIRQYTEEPSNEATTLVVHPGANGTSTLYDDDGRSFNYRNGEFMRIEMTWRDATRTLALRLTPGSRMLSSVPLMFNVRVAGSAKLTPITFNGSPVSVRV